MSTENQPELSIAYKAGQQARKEGVKLKDSVIRNLLPGCRQYNDFIAGFDSVSATKAARKVKAS